MNQKLEQLVEKYQPNQQTIAKVKQNKIILLVGISGAGKDTVKQELLKTNQFHHLVSHTTRNRRQNNGIWEQEGVEYHFIDQNQAVEMLENNHFIEAKIFGGNNNLYGTSLFEFEKAKKLGKMPIADVDIAGADEYYKITDNMLAFFILPPNFELWVERFKHRYDSEQEFLNESVKRFQTAKKELEFVLNQNYYYYIINDDLAQAVKDIQTIINGQNYDNSVGEQVAKNLLAKIKQNLVK